MSFSYRMKILERHLDLYGHVNNARYLEILEEARWEIVTTSGKGAAEIQSSGIGPVLLEAQLKFMRELKLRQEIVVKTSFSGLKGKTAVIHQAIEDLEGNTYLDAELVMGIFDLRKRRLITIPEDWLITMGMKN